MGNNMDTNKFFFVLIGAHFLFSFALVKAELSLEINKLSKVGKMYGTKDVSPELAAFIRQVIKKLDIPKGDEIKIKQYNDYALYYSRVGKTTVQIIWGSNKPYIYLHEEWFNTLPDGQKEFVIARELMGLKYNYGSKLLKYLTAAFLGYGYLVGMTNMYMYKRRASESLFWSVDVCFAYIFPLFMLGVGTYASRSLAYQADAQAVKELNVLEHAIAFYKRMRLYIKEINSEMPKGIQVVEGWINPNCKMRMGALKKMVQTTS